jgi:hypothetical protein
MPGFWISDDGTAATAELDHDWVVKFNSVSPAHAELLGRGTASPIVDTRQFVLRPDMDQIAATGEESKFRASKQRGYQLPETDVVAVEENPWASTAGEGGFPFCVRGDTSADCTRSPEVAGRRELGQVLELRAISDDIQGRNDSFVYAAAPLATPEPGQAMVSYRAYIAGANNDFVNGWAKGCVMARASAEKNAAYIAVCRPGNDHPISLQYRECTGCDTRGQGAVFPGLRHGESAAWVRLDLGKNADGATVAQVYGSADGGDASWEAIGAPHIFPDGLPLVGLAASSWNKDSMPFTGKGARFRFARFARDGVPITADQLNTWFVNGAEGSLADLSASAPACPAPSPTITFDLRALSLDAFGIYDMPDGRELDSHELQDVPLAPGMYVIQLYSAMMSDVVFTVNPDGTLDYDDRLSGAVSGKGTHTLTVTGFPVDLDMRPLSMTGLQPLLFGNPPVLDTTRVQHLRLMPAPGYAFVAGSSQIPGLGFGVDLDGHPHVSADEAAFASVQGDTVVVSGYPVDVTVHTRGMRWLDSNLFGLAGGVEPADEVVHMRLLPLWVGTYSFTDAVYGGSTFGWNLGADGKVEFDPSFDGMGTGRGTTHLEITLP